MWIGFEEHVECGCLHAPDSGVGPIGGVMCDGECDGRWLTLTVGRRQWGSPVFSWGRSVSGTVRNPCLHKSGLCQQGPVGVWGWCGVVGGLLDMGKEARRGCIRVHVAVRSVFVSVTSFLRTGIPVQTLALAGCLQPDQRYTQPQ